MTLYPAVSQVVQGLVFPPGILGLGIAIGSFAAVAGRWRLAFVLVVTPMVATLVMSLPWVADRIALPLEQRALAESHMELATRALPRTAVVLGGAIGAAGPDARAAATGYDLSSAADRVVTAARLWRTGQVDRLVLAGGSLEPPSEAELMARFASDLGVPRSAMLLEGDSRTTHENAERVANLLRRNNLGRDVALVSSALHLPRAMAEFRCVGLAPVAVPAEFEALGAVRESPTDWMPSLANVDRSRRALKEWFGALLGAHCP